MDKHIGMFRHLLEGQKGHPLDFWTLVPDDELNPERAKFVLVFGCPNGAGAYLQVLFDDNGELINAQIINTDGDPCSCKWCKPPKKRRKK